MLWTSIFTNYGIKKGTTKGIIYNKSFIETFAPNSTDKVRFCIKCGSKLDVDYKFCLKCGNKIYNEE